MEIISSFILKKNEFYITKKGSVTQEKFLDVHKCQVIPQEVLLGWFFFFFVF